MPAADRSTDNTLILLPGFMCDADLWRDVEPALAGRRAVLHGDMFQDASVAAMAARVLDAAPLRFAVVGFSMGGFVAREIALAAPGRVRALGLIATSAMGTTPARAARNRARRARIADQPFRGLSRSDLRNALHPSRRHDEVLVERMLAMGARLGKEVLLRQLSAERADGHARLPEIRCPTLVVAAEDDALRPRVETDRLAAGIPGVCYEVVAGSGHMIPLERPDALAAMLNGWLDQAAPATG